MVSSFSREDLSTVADVQRALTAHEYVADEGLATAIFLALRLQRPLLLEGQAGVGKTEVAKVLSRWTGGELVRLQCYEGIDSGQAVYEWDYARQLLHLRAVEAVGAPVVEDELYSERFLVRRPLLRAIAYPDFDRELAILPVRAPHVAETTARQVAAGVEVLRDLDLYKPPGVAETIDWAEALVALGCRALDDASVDATLGTVLKYREDQE